MGPKLHAHALVDVVLAPPEVEPLFEQPRRHFGLRQVLDMGRPLAHRLGRRGMSGCGREPAVEPGAANVGLRGAVRRSHQAQLPLQPGQGQHAVLA